MTKTTIRVTINAVSSGPGYHAASTATHRSGPKPTAPQAAIKNVANILPAKDWKKVRNYATR